MSRSTPQHHKCGSQGFSLLEVIAALAIMAVAIGALMQLYAGSLRTLRNSEDNTVAMLNARSLVEEALAVAKPEDLEKSISLERGMRAERTVERIKPEKAPEYYIITVRVSWEPRGSVTLTARRAAGGEED